MTAPAETLTDLTDTVAELAHAGEPDDARWTLRRRLTVLMAISAAFLIVAALSLTLALRSLDERRRDVIFRVDPATLAARDLSASMVDQETGMRGFALTGDPTFLEPYDRGRDAQRDADARLEGIVTDGAAREALIRFRGAADRWRRDAAQPIIDQVSSTGPGATTTEGIGRELFDSVRTAGEDLQTALLVQRDAAVDDLTTTARLVGTIVFLVLLGFVVDAVIVTVALKRSVSDPVDRLTREVRAVADGDLTHTVTSTGPPELRRLGGDIDAMRIRILDELARLETASAAIEQQAVELGRSNADLEQFAYVASHDLQEPLRKIAGFCQLLEKRYKGQLDERADEYIHFVVDGAKRMQDLINDLLSFSRVGRTTDRFVPVDLERAAVAACGDLAAVIADADAEVDVGPLPTVSGDLRLLTALFQNLVGNAVKFAREDQPPRVRIRATEIDDGDRWEITVTDNGIGIEPEYAEQIFTLFQRLHNKSRYGGTGIGLALCKRIVEFHGGEIRLDTDEPGLDGGPGSTFRLILPTNADQTGPSTESEPAHVP